MSGEKRKQADDERAEHSDHTEEEDDDEEAEEQQQQQDEDDDAQIKRARLEEQQQAVPADAAERLRALADVFAGVDGYSISKGERQRLREQGVFNGSLTYGEVDMGSFVELLSQAPPRAGDVFYDIGSGTGKALVAAAACFPFARAVGIEILTDLHAAAERAVRALLDRPDGPALACRDIRPVLHDSFAYDWSDGDVVFAAATCFDDEMMAQLLGKVQRLKAGARVISLTRALAQPGLELVHNKRYRYGKGAINAFVYRRV